MARENAYVNPRGPAARAPSSDFLAAKNTVAHKCGSMYFAGTAGTVTFVLIRVHTLNKNKVRRPFNLWDNSHLGIGFFANSI